MGLLNADYKGVALERVLAAGILRCELGDMREAPPREGGNGTPGSGPIGKTIINLTLTEAHKTVDGDVVNAGFPFVTNIAEWADRPLEGPQKMKELALAALGLDRKEHNAKDDWIKLLADRGGWSGLKGSHLLVEVEVKKGFNNVKAWNRIPR